MYVVVLEFDTLEDANELYLDELATVCRPDNGEPVMQTLAAANGLQMYFEGIKTHKGKYEVYKLTKCHV